MISYPALAVSKELLVELLCSKWQAFYYGIIILLAEELP